MVETHGGKGFLFGRCYGRLARGVVFELDRVRAADLALRRPTWAVYQGDCVPALAAGVGFHWSPNYFDIDPWGECWPTVDAIFSGIMAKRPRRLVLVVNDGGRLPALIGKGWTMASMKTETERRGNAALHAEYLDVCRELVTVKSQTAGFALVKWAGYHCGKGQKMTHFAAVLDSRE